MPGWKPGWPLLPPPALQKRRQEPHRLHQFAVAKRPFGEAVRAGLVGAAVEQLDLGVHGMVGHAAS